VGEGVGVVQMDPLTADAAPALECRDLYRFFRTGDVETLALRGVSMTAWSGEVLAIVGPSGSGKSTLLSCLAGLDEPAGGTVWVEGQRLTHRSETQRAATRVRSIGVLFQTNNLVAHLTVAQNIEVARRLRSDGRLTVDVLDQVGLSARAHAYPAELSGGEAARAALAVALANDPAVLLADEPTGELDGVTERVVLDLLRDRAARGCAVVVVTHNPTVVASADRVVTLHEGAVVA
jgi:putative ABC transport system ATP-binding protein